MSAEDLANEIESLIIEANSVFADDILKVQDKLYSNLISKLKDLDTDKDGYILQTAKNRKVLDEAQTVIDETLSGYQYQNAINRHTSIISKIDDLNSSYFSSVSSSFAANRTFIKSLQTQAFDTIETYLLGDGLGFQVKTPLVQIINENINTGGSFSGFLEQIRTFIKGTPDLDGRLLSYSRGLLRDTLFNYARAYQNSVTSDLGLQFYLYSGGLIDKSRPFCIQRAGNYYHQLEIESWASEDWKGKNPLTTKSSIFVLVAGYNCSHQLIPVHEIIVPKSDIERAKELGYFK